MQHRADSLLEHQSRPEWISRPERGSRLALRLIVGIALTLGRRIARGFLYPTSAYFLLASSGARTASRQYLARALGREPRIGDLYRHFLTFAATILDRIFLLRGEYAHFDIRTQGEHLVKDLVASGKGCFLLGSHLGSFEVIRFLSRHGSQPPVSLVMYEENARTLTSVLDTVKTDFAPHVIALGKVDAMLKVEEALARGELVGMLGDRTIAGKGTVACEFLGAPAQFPVGPFVVARMLDRPIVLMFGLYRGGNRYDVHFERLVEPHDTADTPQRPPHLKDSVRSYVERLEHYCRLAPYNWFNFYEYWK